MDDPAAPAPIPFASRPLERRRDVRLPHVRPAKARCAETGRFYSGRTIDLSTGGTLLELDHPAPLPRGRRLRLAITTTTTTTEPALVRSEELVDATVVRSMGMVNKQRVGVSFDHRHRLALAG